MSHFVPSHGAGSRSHARCWLVRRGAGGLSISGGLGVNTSTPLLSLEKLFGKTDLLPKQEL